MVSNFMSCIACIVLLDRFRSLNVLGSAPVAGKERVEVGSTSGVAVVSSPFGAPFSVFS